MNGKLPYSLRIHNRRVLVPVGEECTFGCRYCYTRTSEVFNGDIDVSAILDGIKALNPNDYDIIELGYDGDPLASKSRFFALGPPLALLGKHLNISTKGTATDPTTRDWLRHLVDISNWSGGGLSALVSVCCWSSASIVEPNTPSPAKRLRFGNWLTKELGVPYFLALRPVLPGVTDEELRAVIRKARRYQAKGVVAGPLYVDVAGTFMRWNSNSFDHSEPAPIPWAPVNLNWRRIENPSRLDMLVTYASSLGVPFFTASVDAIRTVMPVTSHGISH